MPLVSIIIPFYNTPLRFLMDAIESVLAQRYDDWELLLVDDGSEDEARSAAKRLLSGHEARMRYLTHPGRANLGMSATRNLGLRHAQGRYVAFLDSDDAWLPHKLSEQVAVMEDYPAAAMLYGHTMYWHSWRRVPAARDYIQPLGVSVNRLIAPPRLVPRFLRGTASLPGTCSALFRREALERIGGCVPSFRSLYEDQALFTKICLAFPVYVSDRCWDRYRQHPASSTKTEVSRHGDYRRRYLAWLEEYLGNQGIDDETVWAALRKEQLLLDDPTPFRWHQRSETLRRRGRKLRHRVLGWLGRAAEQ